MKFKVSNKKDIIKYSVLLSLFTIPIAMGVIYVVYEIFVRTYPDTPLLAAYIICPLVAFLNTYVTVRFVFKKIYELEIAKAEIETLSRTDQLSKLYNRRYFYELATREFSSAVRNDFPVSALMIDLDHFKLINDTHGHITGDLVIEETARRIKAAMRELDIACRFGGEEFLALLPHADLEEAVRIAERIHGEIGSVPVKNNGASVSATASIGVAQRTERIESLDRLIASADSALYEAKEKGRNRIESAEV